MGISAAFRDSGYDFSLIAFAKILILYAYHIIITHSFLSVIYV
jgi:hypothetical protein